jgi:hypothetical protein
MVSPPYGSVSTFSVTLPSSVTATVTSTSAPLGYSVFVVVDPSSLTSSSTSILASNLTYFSSSNTASIASFSA